MPDCVPIRERPESKPKGDSHFMRVVFSPCPLSHPRLTQVIGWGEGYRHKKPPSRAKPVDPVRESAWDRAIADGMFAPLPATDGDSAA
jgi:hypothetical protein